MLSELAAGPGVHVIFLYTFKHRVQSTDLIMFCSCFRCPATVIPSNSLLVSFISNIFICTSNSLDVLLVITIMTPLRAIQFSMMACTDTLCTVAVF